MKQSGETIKPRTIAPIGPAKPHAGVIATKPAIAPDAAPSIDGLPFENHSTNIHEAAAAHVASKVFANTKVANPLASRFEPTLKPNQPTHNNDAPIIVIVTLCGGIASLPKPIRLPNTNAPTKPAIPALI